jgi:hypothetical protein
MNCSYWAVFLFQCIVIVFMFLQIRHNRNQDEWQKLQDSMIMDLMGENPPDEWTEELRNGDGSEFHRGKKC